MVMAWQWIGNKPLSELIITQFKDIYSLQGLKALRCYKKVRCGCSILLAHISFVSCQSALPFLIYSIFKFNLENPRSRSWVRWTLKVTTWVQHFIDSHPFHSMSIHHPIPEIWLFQNLTWKTKVKVMGEGYIESHKVGVTSYRLTSISFHVNWPFHSWVTAFSKFDLENPRSRSNDHDVAQLQV